MISRDTVEGFNNCFFLCFHWSSTKRQANFYNNTKFKIQGRSQVQLQSPWHSILVPLSVVAFATSEQMSKVFSKEQQRDKTAHFSKDRNCEAAYAHTIEITYPKNNLKRGNMTITRHFA